MATISQPWLFSWKEIDEASDLDRLRLVLGALPDEALVSFLEQRRGRGRDDYPIRPMWNAVIAGIVFQHPNAATGKPVRDKKKLAEPDGRRDTDADWGVKTYKGTRKDGSTWDKVTRWFGYKLHLMVDSVYEMPPAFSVDIASSSDMKNLTPLVEDLKGHHQEIYDDINELSADKGYDSSENNSELYDDHNIKPVIDKRELWKEKKYETLFPNRYDVFCYDEAGSVYCSCPSGKRGEDELRELAFVGFEKDRDTLKYRCPAAAFGFNCSGRVECEELAQSGVGDFGRTIRVPMETDRRIFTPIARPTGKWTKAYNLRTSVERVNGRIDRVLGFEQHTIRGKEKMEMRVTLALVVMLAMALGRIRADQADKMRSLTTPAERAA